MCIARLLLISKRITNNKVNAIIVKKCQQTKIRTIGIGLLLSAELEQQLEKSCGVLSPSPLSALLLIDTLLLRV